MASRLLWMSRETKHVTAREVTNYMGADATVYDQIDTSVTTEFVGYDHLTFESPRLLFLPQKLRS